MHRKKALTHEAQRENEERIYVNCCNWASYSTLVT